METQVTNVPEPGHLVRVRGRHWVVADVARSQLDIEAPHHLVTLTSVEDDRYEESIRVIWEVEAAPRILEQATLPSPEAGNFDDPDRLGAFLDAVRWGAVTSADSTALQAPFRSGIAIEDYQLDPVVRAVRMPRVNLLIADDVGLGKTIEAGLVVQELLLRHRARTVLVVCPASLCIKWRDEMNDKFGLEFRIVDTELLRHLRRTRGLRANPWTHFPRLIVSMDWLKRDRPMRLLRDVLPPVPTYPRKFDVLIVDEVHNVAPSSRGRYATDSLRTKAIRSITPHFEHRLFVSATPHNGYRESWTALLELLDSQRFARGIDPDPAQLQQIMVRRLKSEIPPNPDGTPRFPKRVIEAIPVAYPDEEREAHRLLKEYTDSRKEQAKDDTTKTATDFSLRMLKKRLFSSPAAFASTLEVHIETATNPRAKKENTTSPRVLRSAIERAEEEEVDETEQSDNERSALEASARASAPLTKDELALLEQLGKWAGRARGRADAKAKSLLAWIDDVVRPQMQDGNRLWNDQRVIVFTEYRDTQKYLHDLFVAHGLGGERLALLFGGMDQDSREDVKNVFQADPSLDPVRILLATDAASEGIDLQLHCHRLVHYEIPWNPNRLEQRNGRVDRHGQRAPEVAVHHFVGSGYEKAKPGSLEEDLEFLLLVAKKVDNIREDLGSVGPVIASQVEERMLGRRNTLDENEIGRAVPRGKIAKLERDLKEQIGRLRDRLDESIAELHLGPDNIERVVQVALHLANQPGLQQTEIPRTNKKGDVFDAKAFRLPRLTHSWARTAEGLQHPVTKEVRPITFDHQVAAGHDDVVLAHLGHRLVQQSMWLLRAEIWRGGAEARLWRVTARLIPEGIIDQIAVVAHGRLVITGGLGHRLHEEIIASGGLIRGGRFGRFRSIAETNTVLAAPTIGIPGDRTKKRLAESWPDISEALMNSLTNRQEERAASLQGVLAKRAEADAKAVEQVLVELERTIRAQLEETKKGVQEALLLYSSDERQQVELDIEALERRLDEIPDEIETEKAAVTSRYEDPMPRLFPAAIEFCVPESLDKGE